MWLKYLMYITDIPLVLKYHTGRELVVIGTVVRQEELLLKIINEFVSLNVTERKVPSNRKVKYEFFVDRAKFFDTLEKIERLDVMIQKVQSHGRLLR